MLPFHHVLLLLLSPAAKTSAVLTGAGDGTGAEVPCWDPADATNCLQDALDSSSASSSGSQHHQHVHIPNMGRPWLVRDHGLWVRSDNLLITLAPGVVIEAAAGDIRSRSTWWKGSICEMGCCCRRRRALISATPLQLV